MNHMLDHLLVGAVLLTAFGYAIYALGPRALRTRILLWAVRALRVLPPFFGLRGLAQRLADAAMVKSGGCGGCDDCASGQSVSPTSSAEVRVPLSTIGKRPRA